MVEMGPKGRRNDAAIVALLFAFRNLAFGRNLFIPPSCGCSLHAQNLCILKGILVITVLRLFAFLRIVLSHEFKPICVLCRM